jgi:hypothetical protein
MCNNRIEILKRRREEFSNADRAVERALKNSSEILDWVKVPAEPIEKTSDSEIFEKARLAPGFERRMLQRCGLMSSKPGLLYDSHAPLVNVRSGVGEPAAS